MKDIKVKKFTYTIVHMKENQILKLDVGFIDRLKFLFQGSNANFIIENYKLKRKITLSNPFVNKFYDVNLDDKCRECKNLYSSMECEMCEDYDMFK